MDFAPLPLCSLATLTPNRSQDSKDINFQLPTSNFQKAYLALVLGAGLTLGTFTSRFLAENSYHTLPGLNSLPWTAFLSLAVTFGLLAFWRLYSAACARQGKMPLGQACPERSRRALADDALTYTPLFLLLLYLAQGEVNPLQAKVLLCGSLLLVIALKVKVLLKRGLDFGYFDCAQYKLWTARLSSPKSLDFGLLLGLFVLTFIVYLSTLSPTVGEADSFEFQVVSYTLGIAHPTGYPLYILLGKLFTLLPIGNVAYRVNLISPLFASLATIYLYLCLVHLTKHRVASLLVSLTFAFSRTFWSQAVIAEVYTLNAFFVALVFYLLLKRISESANQQTCGEPSRTINKTAFVYGLSLTNHITMALLAPAMAIYALLTGLWTKPRRVIRNQVFGTLGTQNTRNDGHSRSPRNHNGEEKPGFFFTDVKKVLRAVGLFLLGLSVYLYIPLRWPALHGRSIALGEFANWVLGSRFRGALHWDAWIKDPERYLILGRLILEQYSQVGLILGLLGLVWLFIKRRREASLLLVAYVTYLFYGLNYYVPDISAFIIPAHLIFAIWIGAGLHGLLQVASGKWQVDKLATCCLLLAALLPLSLLWTNLPQVDMSHHGWEAYRWGQYVLGLDLPPGAAILADSEKIAPLYYLQRVERMRPDLDIIVMGDEAGYRQQLETRLGQGQPVYLARYLPGLEGRFHLRSLGPLVEVGTTPLTDARGKMRDAQTLLPCSFGQNIRLLGYDADSLTIEPPSYLRLTLFWQALDKIEANYHVRLRLVGESGHVWLEEEGRHPVSGYYPTVAWRPGEIVPDFHELAIGKALPPGTYKLEVGLFPPFSQESIPTVQIGRVHVMEGEGWQSPDDLAIPYPLRASFDDELILLGYDRPSFVRPNGQATLTLYWQRLREGTEDYNIALQMVDEAGKVFWQENVPPLFGEYPTSRWGVGQIMQTSHELTMPATTGEVGLRVGLSHGSGEMLPGRSHWLAPLSEWCPLRPIQVRSAPLAGGPVINFDNRILLLGYNLDRQQLRPGEVMELSLTWQCLKRMDEDYTVFVHILDKEQRIWGQEDVWPVHGTYPTSQWKEGEIIEDIHSVRLSYEAPPGEYQIEVGLYLLSTMARLPVLDEEMRPVDDKVIIKMTNDQ
jgi:hypothetical protein